MSFTFFLTAALITAAALPPGTQRRELTVEGLPRNYLFHVPPETDPRQPLPVVLVLHGAGMNAKWMMTYTGLNRKSDEAKFIAVYPNGTGFGPFLTWNAGGVTEPLADGIPDDVAFLNAVLDDLGGVVQVDSSQVFACGYSVGGMMCYRLAIELSERIAAIASVAGPMTAITQPPSRPVPVMHFHGTADQIVPPTGPGPGTPAFLSFLSVEETIQAWCDYDGCDFDSPVVTSFPDIARDGTTCRQTVYGPGEDNSEVVSITIQNGGHTWPGGPPLFGFLGKTTQDLSANELLWEFFEKHRFSMP